MRRLVLTCSLFALVPACAQGGGGDVDSGRERLDAGGDFDAGRLPGLDAGMMSDDGGSERDAGQSGFDAGRDGGMIRIDAGPDAGPVGCTSAAECSDGLFCNGVERCNAGTCGPGTPVTCDDSIGCTMNRCLEPTSGTTPDCDYVPIDSMCPAGQTCNPATGCTTGCAESPCRLLNPQCGCPAGSGCYLNGSMRTCASAGSAGEGTTCTSVNSCQPGLICLNVSRDMAVVTNMCMRFCATDANCVGAGSNCIYTIDDGMGGSVPGVTVCSRSCNPITSVGCVAGSSCQIFQETAAPMGFFTDCLAPVGPGTQFDPCTDATDCARGFTCVGMPGRCLAYCDEPNTWPAAGCPFDQACYGFTTPLVIGSTEYGVCDTYP